jgi:hypothetical protein
MAGVGSVLGDSLLLGYAIQGEYTVFIPDCGKCGPRQFKVCNSKYENRVISNVPIEVIQNMARCEADMINAHAKSMAEMYDVFSAMNAQATIFYAEQECKAINMHVVAMHVHA